MPPLAAKTTRSVSASPGTLQNPEGPDHVHVGVEDRLGHRDPNVGLGGQVEDHFGPAAGHELDHLGRAHVHLVHGELMAGRGPGVG